MNDLIMREEYLLEAAREVNIQLPKFKAKHFIGNSHITPYGKIKQYLIEYNARKNAVDEHRYFRDKKVLEIELEKEKKKYTDNEIEQKMIDLEIQHLEAQYQGFIIKVENMENEMQMFKDLLEEVCESPEGKHSDGRTILEAIQDISIREKYEAEYWTFRMAKQTAMDMIAYGRAGVGNMDSIAMLEGEQQQAIMKIACYYFVRNENRTKHFIDQSNSKYQANIDAEELAKTLELEYNRDAPNF